MRRLVWLGIVFALLWSGWWFFAASTLQTGLDQWMTDRRAEGWQAETAQTTVTGFPSSLNAVLDDVVLADPQTGVALSLSQMELDAPAYWPGYVTLILPTDEIMFSSPTARRSITAEAATAALRLHPGQALELEEMNVSSQAWTLAAPEGTIASGLALAASVQQDIEDTALYHVSLTAPSFQLGTLPRQAFRVPEDWPISFDELGADLSIELDRPLDRKTVEVARPLLQHIHVENAQAAWGALSFRTAADLAVSPNGTLTGDLTFQARNWREMLNLAETASVLPSSLRPQLESVLAALARGSGNADTIDVALTLRQGEVFLGFIPLGPAPRLILR